MNSKNIIWIGVLLAVSIGIGLFVIPAQAGAVYGTPDPSADEKLLGDLLVSVYRVGGVNSPTTIVIYDKDGKIVEEISTSDGGYRFTGMKAGGYHVVAYADGVDLLASADIDVQTAKVASVSLKMEKTTTTAGNVVYGSCSGGVSGDGNILKISGSYGVEVIYLKCGRVVATYGTAGCSCRGGNWRYVNDCVKTQPIYVNLPCSRGRN